MVDQIGTSDITCKKREQKRKTIEYNSAFLTHTSILLLRVANLVSDLSGEVPTFPLTFHEREREIWVAMRLLQVVD